VTGCDDQRGRDPVTGRVVDLGRERAQRRLSAR